MANVDSQLHNDGAADRAPEKPARGLRGAAGGIYIGPVLSRAAVDGEGQTITHATGADAGGADGSTGYRKSNSFSVDGDATGQGMGAGGTLHVRKTGRSVYRGDGVAGGSVAGYPAQRAGQRSAAAAGDTGTADSPTGAGAFIDKRSVGSAHGGIYLGSAGRGTRVVGETVTSAASARGGALGATPFIPKPTVATTPTGAGVIGIDTGGAAGIAIDMHADDITGGARGLAGCEILVFERGTDTDEDGEAPVLKDDFDSTSVTDLTAGITASATYAVYVRFKDANGNVGPFSDRSTVAAHA